MDILNINKLNIINISKEQLEKLNWKIIDEDDDGNIKFEFYCDDVKIKYIK
jgi:hypothetical protein